MFRKEIEAEGVAGVREQLSESSFEDVAGEEEFLFPQNKSGDIPKNVPVPEKVEFGAQVQEMLKVDHNFDKLITFPPSKTPVKFGPPTEIGDTLLLEVLYIYLPPYPECVHIRK